MFAIRKSALAGLIGSALALPCISPAQAQTTLTFS